MRAILSMMLSAGLVIHAMIGCCWHAAHDASCCREAPVAHVAEGCCHHHHHHHDGGESEHSQPEKPCQDSHCQGLCSYLTVEKTQVDSPAMYAAIDFVAVLPATFQTVIISPLAVELAPDIAAGPPVRLHLAHQVLLI